MCVFYLLEIQIMRTRPLGPQLALSCYGYDRFGNDVVRGYGATFLPSVSGT